MKRHLVWIALSFLLFSCAGKSQVEPESKPTGEGHYLDTYKTLSSLAVQNIHDGKLSEAESFFLRALSVVRENQPDSNEELTVLARLADLCLTQKKSRQADQYYDSICSLYKKIKAGSGLDKESVDWLDALSYDYLEYKTRSPVRRERYLMNALNLKEMAGSKKYQSEILRAITLHYFSQNDYASAESYATKLVKLDQDLTGPESVTVAQELCTLARIKQNLAKYSEAEVNYRKSISIYMSKETADRTVVPMIKSELARCLLDAKERALSQSEAQEALDMLVRAGLSNHESTLQARRVLADISSKQGDYGSSAKQLETIINIVDSKYGTNNPINLKDMESLKSAYKKLGSSKKVRDLDEKINYIESLVKGKN